MPAYPTIDNLDVAAKRVLVRADLNVPIKDGVVGDQTRIERTVPGLRELAGKGARVIVTSHLGRPKGKPSAEFSLRPVGAALARALGAPVAFADSGDNPGGGGTATTERANSGMNLPTGSLSRKRPSS